MAKIATFQYACTYVLSVLSSVGTGWPWYSAPLRRMYIHGRLCSWRHPRAEPKLSLQAEHGNSNYSYGCIHYKRSVALAWVTVSGVHCITESSTHTKGRFYHDTRQAVLRIMPLDPFCQLFCQRTTAKSSQDSSHRSVNEMEEVARRQGESVALSPV